METMNITTKHKMDWVFGIGKDTYIADYARCINNFFSTSCLLTAAVIRYHINGKLWWELSDEKLTPGFLKKHKTFQISLGKYEDYDEHVLTVHNNFIYQSFYNITEWEIRVFPAFLFETKDNEDKEIIMTKEILDNLIGKNRLTEDSYDYMLTVP